MWTWVVEGTVEKISPLLQWKHRQPAEIESDLAYLEINRSELLSALSEYLDNSSLRTKMADWLFLNVLTYSEYIATVIEVRKHSMGTERYIKSLFPPKNNHSTDIADFTSRPWHLPATLAMVITAWAIHPLIGVGVTSYAIFKTYRQKQLRVKINAIFASMLQTYSSFNTLDLSWPQVTSSLERSRALGVIWDSSLYALAELRTGNINVEQCTDQRSK